MVKFETLFNPESKWLTEIERIGLKSQLTKIGKSLYSDFSRLISFRELQAQFSIPIFQKLYNSPFYMINTLEIQFQAQKDANEEVI